jgi:hypothetical protein
MRGGENRFPHAAPNGVGTTVAPTIVPSVVLMWKWPRFARLQAMLVTRPAMSPCSIARWHSSTFEDAAPPAGLVEHQAVARHSGAQAREAPGVHPLEEFGRVRAADFQLAERADVDQPHRAAYRQRFLLDGAAIREDGRPGCAAAV